MKISTSYIKKTVILNLILFMGVFLLLPGYVYAVERAFTEEEIKLLKEVKTIRLVVKAYSWQGNTPNIRNDIKIKMEEEGFEIVSEETSNYDATIFVDYKEIKGSDYIYTKLPPNIMEGGSGSNIYCFIRVIHKTIGNVFETSILGETPKTVEGNYSLYSAAETDFRQKTKFKHFGKLLALYFGKSVIPLTGYNWAIKKELVEYLGNSGDKRFVKPLINALKDEDWHVRREAAEALGKTKDLNAVEPLIVSLKENDLWVRKWIISALKEITGHDFGENQKAWQEWWDKSKAKYSE